MAPPFVFPSSLRDLEQGADGDDEPSLRPQNPVTVAALRAADLEEFIKGAIFSRHVSDSNNRDTVYLDQNYVEDMRVSPIYIGGRTKHLLQRAIWNDTSFLTSVNVMDYSLLVGVDKQKHELVFGIIDYLRQYTWDKHLETWVKTSLVVPRNVSPTVISPREYKKRFRKFMAKYFLAVPDTWSPKNSSGPYKSFGHGNKMLVEVHNDDNLLQHPIEAEARS